MLIINVLRTAATIGGSPFCLKKCSALGSTATGAAVGSAAGPIGALVGGGLGLASSLIGGLFGASNTNKTNEMNYKIWQEQKEFNAKEAQKQRNWQKLMQDMYGTASAKASQYRAAGLNSLLSNVSSDSVGTGSSATAGEAPVMQSVGDYGIGAAGQSIQRGVEDYINARSVESQVSLNKTLETLNDASSQLKDAQKEFTEMQTQESSRRIEQMKLNIQYLTDTFSTRTRQAYLMEDLLHWQQSDMKYSAITKMYDLFNIKPEIVQNMQSSTVFNYASAFRAAADGQMTLKEIQYLPTKYAIMNTMALGSYMSGQGSLLGGRAAVHNANTMDRNTFPQWLQDSFTTDYLLGKKGDEDALKYIRGDVRLKHLLDINIANNEWTLNKLMQEPQLIRNLSTKFGEEGSLLNKQNEAFWTDKYIERATNVMHTANETLDTAGGLITKGLSKYIKAPVKETHNYKYDWKNNRWNHDITVESYRRPKK